MAPNLVELVERFRHGGAQRFAAEWDVPVLIRRIDDKQHVEDSRSFHTRAAASVGLAEEALRRALSLAQNSEAPGEPRSSSAGRQMDDDDDPDLRVDDVLMLSKRPGATTFLERIGIGRVANVDVTIPLPRVSKYHAYATDEAGVLRLCDARSTFGTFVRGVKLQPLEPHVLEDGVAVRFGPYAFRYHTASGFLRHVQRLATAGQ